MSKYGSFSGQYFSVFGLNTGKYGPKKTPYLDIFHAVSINKNYLVVRIFTDITSCLPVTVITAFIKNQLTL